jgi:molybdopterin-containing oxidoreductase family membrane subunit
MLEKALYGSKRYYAWVGLLMLLIAAGMLAYLQQFTYGLGVTGISRDVSWGLYISQFTFMVGVAASAVMVAIPYYLHDYKTFGKIVILGEFLAVSAVIVCMLFVFVDMGQPTRFSILFCIPRPIPLCFGICAY